MNANEKELYAHVTMFGQPGYPIRKIGSAWFWVDAFGVSGCPSPFKTKKAATARFEMWVSLKRAEKGQEAFAEAVADLTARGFTQAEIEAKIEAATETR